MDVELSLLLDYPPRLLIYIQPTQPGSGVSPPPEVVLTGLDRECIFNLLTMGLNIERLTSEKH